METILVNLSYSKTSVRREQLLGRDHIVVPMTSLREGVLHGSKGPLLYTASEIGIDPWKWDLIPIVNNHPMKDGKPVKARSRDVLNKNYIGVVLETTFTNNALRHEAWFDVEAANRVDKRIVQKLLAGESINVSTGLFTSNEWLDAERVFNSGGLESKYLGIARNYRPDHIALLLDESGACPVPDCGVLINAEGEPMPKVTEQVNPITEEKKNAMSLTANQRQEMVAELVANCGCTEVKSAWSKGDEEILNALPDAKLTQIHSTQKELVANHAASKKAREDAAKEAERVAVQNAATRGASGLNPSTTSTTATTTAPTTNSAPVGLSEQDKEDLAFARGMRQQMRAEAINTIIANKKNTFTPEELGEMQLPILNKMAEIAKQETVAEIPKKDQTVVERITRPSSYAGIGPVLNVQSAQQPVVNSGPKGPLIPPSMEWVSSGK